MKIEATNVLIYGDNEADTAALGKLEILGFHKNIQIDHSSIKIDFILPDNGLFRHISLAQIDGVMRASFIVKKGEIFAQGEDLSIAEAVEQCLAYQHPGEELDPAYIAAAEHRAILLRDGLYADEAIEVVGSDPGGDNAGGYDVIRCTAGEVEDITSFDKSGQHVW